MIHAKRPKVELLGPEFIRKIVDEAYELLERHGIFIENEEALGLFSDAGMRVDGSGQRVHITPDLVQDCLESTPQTLSLFDRSGEKEFIIGGDEIHFNPGSAAVSVLDHELREERKPATPDLVDFNKLVETLEHIHLQSTGIISSDVPESISDCYRLYVGLIYSTKPFVTGTFRVESFKPMLELLAAVRGSEAELAKKPLAIFDACPSPPLKWSRLTAQSLIDAARAGIPSELISMGMTGATSLVTIAGTLVQHIAENLCGLAICQLAKRGSPVIFGGSPSSFDMRRGTTPMGAVETMMIDSAYTQIGKSLGLPTHAYMGLSDSKLNDCQSGLESGIGAVLAALSGVNVISGPGMLDFESAQSLEKLVIDNEICGMAYRLIQGISQHEEPLAVDKFAGLVPEGRFLSLPHTRKWYKIEHIQTALLDRETYDAWALQGRNTLADRAHREVARRLKNHVPAPLPPAVHRDVERIMTAYARANGFSGIPRLSYD